MTNWTEEADVTTTYSETDDVSTSYAKDIVKYDGDHYLWDDTVIYDGPGTTYTGEMAIRYIPEGLGLKIAAEDFNWILTEDKLVRIVHSRTEYSEVADVVTVYTEVGDA